MLKSSECITSPTKSDKDHKTREYINVDVLLKPELFGNMEPGHVILMLIIII